MFTDFEFVPTWAVAAFWLGMALLCLALGWVAAWNVHQQ